MRQVRLTPRRLAVALATLAVVLAVACGVALAFAGKSFPMMVFAVGWVALMIFGFVGAIRVAKGDFAHPLFKAQVMLHGSPSACWSPLS